MDRLRYYSTNKPALSYITWGLIQDSKIRKEGIPEFLIINCRFNLLMWDKWKSQSIKNKINSTIWDGVKFKIRENPKITYHVWDEIRIKAAE